MAMEMESVVSSTSDFVGEPLGDLITLCRRNNIGDPHFREAEKMRPYNTHIFTVTCTVGTLSTKTAQGPRKVVAKKKAAFKVLRDLEAKGYPLAKTKNSL